MTRIKFCGITNVDDAELCAGHGAWALGMIFVPGSPRRCKQSEAARIAGALHRRVELVGVFQNPSLDHVTRTAESLGLSMIQLHGEEGPSFCAEIARRTGARIIKAARIRSRADVVALKPYSTDFHLLDGAGGVPFDWRLVRAHRGPVPVIVAGGLTAANVADAIAATDPYAVDVASGVEVDGRPDRKDPGKVAAFADAARSHHAAHSPA